MKDNLIKLTCKELGLTQKQLAQDIGVHEDTVSKWSRGLIDTPKWALKMLELLKIEKKYKNLNSELNLIIETATKLKTE